MSSYKNDEPPGGDYFSELFRVSVHQIIWGANYYTEFLPCRNSWIVWDKKRDWKTQHLSEGELAWASLNIPLMIAEFPWNGFIRCEPRNGFHPHEKPVGLYRWTLDNYAKPGHRILDTHLGSGSSAIAAHYFGCDFVGCELDPDYYTAAVQRRSRPAGAEFGGAGIMKDKLSKPQIAFGLVAGIYSVWAYYSALGDVLALIPFTYIMMPVWLFTAGIHAKGIVERGQANGFLKYAYAPLVVLVLAIDVVWNATLGTIIYRELPREFLFTTRTKRHFIDSNGFRKDRAIYWRKVLNAIDPGHI